MVYNVAIIHRKIFFSYFFKNVYFDIQKIRTFHIYEGFQKLYFGIYNIDGYFPPELTGYNHRKMKRPIIYLKYPKNKKT